MTIFAETVSSELAALEMLWAGREPYPVADAAGYFERLDLEAGRRLFNDCGQIWPGCGEVVRNRKWCIASMAERILSRADAPEQIVIAAAGVAPLSVELLARWPHATIFDVDCCGMSAKNALVDELGCGDAARMHFVPADLTDAPTAADRLSVAGWQAEQPTLMIAEGISYYLDAAHLAALASLLAPGSLVLLDYLVHPGNVHFSRRRVPYELFERISRRFDMTSISTYSPDTLSECLGAMMLEHWTMYDVEMARHGHSLQFPAADMGWIEVAGFRVN